MSKQLVEITGFDELQKQLTRLGKDSLKRREILKILGQVANPTLKAARANAPVSRRSHVQSGKRSKKIIEPGNLKKSLGKIRGKRGSAKVNAVLYVGPRAKGRKNDGWYAKFVHAGTKKQKANRFMQRAADQTQGLVTADAEVKVTRYLQAQINRLSKA